MRKADYAALAEIIRKQIAAVGNEVERAAMRYAIKSVAREFAARASVNKDEFLKACGTPYDPEESYHREPFAADVSEGKNHPIYNAHSYHTKVPHRAIMKFILHYTEPGEVIFDGFAGTGMAQAEFIERVEKVAKIAANHGTPFGSGGESFLRFNLATPRSVVVEAVKRLQAAFADLQ